MRGLSAEDYAAITSLYARYNQAADQDDLALWETCFTEDAVTIRNGIELRRGLAAHVEQRRADPLRGRRQHWNNNLILTRIDESHVQGRCYLMVVDVEGTGSPPAITELGSYIDRVRWDGEEWKFAERVISFRYRPS
ncbi:nuclear transport factor 2 family protein [Arthrobacter sp. B6]|uniref:nuclear transport factor 2 family protein n=1 Tax=Arthrobacter sp. B6 TaxID=1570137 RepID=UPI0008376B61|nr:nuclear transport factor 2 family protein [Arthrobacter sp. B6]